MNIYDEVELQDCPYCGGAGLLEEESGFAWYAVCADCGSQTGSFEYKVPEDRIDAAKRAASCWNMGKILKTGVGE